MALPLTPIAASQARRAVREQLSAWQLTDYLQTVELVMSELVTNAIQHGEPRETLSVAITADPHRIRLSVVDGSSVRPASRQVAADETSGRGMHIVERLVDRWGTEDRAGGGKQVWVEIDRLPRTTA